MNKEKIKRDWWQKGRAFDLWSIPHFLFGVFMSFVPLLIGISTFTALSFTVIFAMLWEIYEKFVNIRETTQNSLLDIILSIVAFTLTSSALLLYPLSYSELLVTAGAVFAVYLFTNISGWFAYRRRNRDFRG